MGDFGKNWSLKKRKHKKLDKLKTQMGDLGKNQSLEKERAQKSSLS